MHRYDHLWVFNKAGVKLAEAQEAKASGRLERYLNEAHRKWPLQSCQVNREVCRFLRIEADASLASAQVLKGELDNCGTF